MNRLFAGITLLLLAVVLLSGVAAAQSNVALKVYVPFPFTVNNKTFPAGNYQITNAGPQRIALNDAQSHFLMYAATINVESRTARSNPGLEFRKDGDNYFLLRVWYFNNRYGQELPQRKFRVASAQRQSSLASAPNQPKPALNERDYFVGGENQWERSQRLPNQN
jgi:hypothetical protein